jgi:hypothetical protein
MKELSIGVAHHDEPLRDFTPIRRASIQDKTLTLEAKGLLAYLLSLPKGWEIRMSHLQKELEMGRDALRRVVRRLEESGYMRLETLPMDGGKFNGKRWRVYPYRITDALDSQSVGSPVGREPRGCLEKRDVTLDIVKENETLSKESSILADSDTMDSHRNLGSSSFNSLNTTSDRRRRNKKVCSANCSPERDVLLDYASENLPKSFGSGRALDMWELWQTNGFTDPRDGKPITNWKSFLRGLEREHDKAINNQ